jgi:hypothetical protein
MLHVLLIGGTGVWCDRAYCKILLELKEQGYPLRVVAICDPIHPSKRPEQLYLAKLMAVDSPSWIFENTQEEVLDRLSLLHQKEHIDIAIVSCIPTMHYVYCRWAAKHQIKTICDKPAVVIENAASDYVAAQSIQKKYEELQRLFADHPTHFVMLLGRRSNALLRSVASYLHDAYVATGIGISYLNLSANFGIQRFAQEFLQGGSHGYIYGVGSASHTFYHLLDNVMWFLQNAPDQVARLKIEIPYLYRVRDYLKQQKFLPLAYYLGMPEAFAKQAVELSTVVLDCEYDFNLQIHLLDKDDKPIGLIQLFNSHSGYSHRKKSYDPTVIAPDNLIEGGRMKQYMLELHQGSIQHMTISRNAEVFGPSETKFSWRAHPVLGIALTNAVNDHYEMTKKEDRNHHKAIIRACIKQWSGSLLAVEEKQLIAGFHNQALSFRIFSLLYELIAYANLTPKQRQDCIRPQSIIEFNSYFQAENVISGHSPHFMD